MRLLNTYTLIVEEFYTDIPPYAILSHTWEKEEITFQDIQHLETAKRKAGFTKVKKACARARKYSFHWIWIDSCCINKESSAELSEAINSMYQYYLDAVVCYVYLSDVSAEYHPRDARSNFSMSKWFTRGWTLQELLAPKHVVFLNKYWTRIGTRWSLRDVVSAATSIPVEIFEGHDIEDYSVAQRMSWAALRKTTRSEDQAYCLMGIFGVNMPPIYGEGGVKAFMRLQQEVIKISDDRSIFAWVAPEDSGEEMRGLLARSPYEFRMSGSVMASNPYVTGEKLSYSFGNNGLRIHLPLLPTDLTRFGQKVFLASLHCQSGKDRFISVYLHETSGQRFVRCRADTLVVEPLPALKYVQDVTVMEPPVPRRARRLDHVSHFHFKLLYSALGHFSAVNPLASSGSDHDDQVSLDSGELAFATLTYQSRNTGESFSVIARDGNRPSFCDIFKDLDTGPHRFPGQSDTLLGQLTNGSYISLTCEMTGNSSSQIVEIDYISTEKANRSNYGDFLTRTLKPPTLAFMVPSQYHKHDLYETFPPDIFRRNFEKETYVTVPDTDATFSGEERWMFRVLSYRYCAPFLDTASSTFYVALGFQGSAPWVDISGLYYGSSGHTIGAVWRTYLDALKRASGSRGRKSRLKNQNTVSGDVFGQGWETIASVEMGMKKDLQLCPHFLRLRMT